ncbi:MAG: histidine phosphatase family protein [Planktomarina sp.]
MTTTFHWVRHGPTHAREMVGWRDVPADLSDKSAIEALNAKLPPKAVVIASDLCRASDTADLLGRTRLPNDPRLREINFGDWDGMPFDEVARTHPDLSRAFWETPGDVAPPGGESWNTAQTRVQDAVSDLRKAHEGQHIIITAHFGTILTQLQIALGCTASQALKFKIDNLSVTTLVDYGESWGVGRVNG